MKRLSWVLVLTVVIPITGCQRNVAIVWEDTKTMGRYLQRKGKLLWTRDPDSRLVASEEEFIGPQEEEYIPLKEEDLKTQFADRSIPQPKEVPGAIGSTVPSIDEFVMPTAHLAGLFRTLYFNTDEHVLKTKDDRKQIAAIAKYMNKNSDLYLCVEGHCDERASETYNLSLGTRRANTIRTLLIERGVSPTRIYTISFGKEMPAVLGNTAEIWAKNRRVEFKIFEQKDPK
ncbi:MAG: OmpA family protein [Chlamydiota bacterium]